MANFVPSNAGTKHLVSLRGGRGGDKCNAFIWDVLTAGGHQPGRISDGRIPSAREWVDPNVHIPGYIIIDPKKGLKPGDIIAMAGHVGIYVPFPSSNSLSLATISATEFIIIHNDWGFRNGQSPTIRRCECDI